MRRRGMHIEFFGGNSEGRRPLEKPRSRWDDNIKTSLEEIDCGGMGWIELTQE
jgi:hypothetical protein